MRLGVLASGTGSILRSILEAQIPVAMVLTDRACRAVDVADEAGIPVEIVARDSWGPGFDRDAYTHRVADALGRHHIDVVAMAGFMTVLGPEVFEGFPGRILNTHPALLPDFKGAHAVRDALAAGVTVTGTTVHVATPAVDEGPVLAQEQVSVLSDDTEDSLHERIKAVERRLYPKTISAFLTALDERQTKR